MTSMLIVGLDWMTAGNAFHNSAVVIHRTGVLTAPHVFKSDFRRKTNLEDDQHQLDILKRNVWSWCKWGLHGQCMKHLVADASKPSHLNPPAAPNIMKKSLTVLFFEREIQIFVTHPRVQTASQWSAVHPPNRTRMDAIGTRLHY